MTAHDYGLTVTAHSIGNQSTWKAIKAGVDGMSMVFGWLYVKFNGKKNVFLVPTENSRNYMNTYYKLGGSNPDELTWIDSYEKIN